MSNSIEQPRYSCALGAQQSVVAIPRGAPIVHAGPGCSNKIQGLLGQGEGYAGGSTIPCTNFSESEVVYGGADKLRTVIEGALKVIDADLYVVLTGCTSDIVGDDVGTLVFSFAEEGVPIVYVETGGFKSNNYVSHETVVNAIIDQYSDRHAQPGDVEPGLVNVFSSVPYQDPFWEGNLGELKRILEGIGLKVNILFGQRAEGLSEWRAIPRASLNIVANAWVGLGIAEHLKEKYGTPYVHFPYFPVGGNETSRFLRLVAEKTGLSVSAEAFIAKEEARFYAHLERTASFLLEFRYGLPRRFHTFLDAGYTVGLAKYLLNELGILPGRLFITDGTPPDRQESVREQLRHVSDRRSAEAVFCADAGEAQRLLREGNNRADSRQRSLILGSGWERDLARELGADLLILGVPVAYRLVLSRGYIGYSGALCLTEDIYDKALNTYR
jgi:nitrogenase molybdenum-iron protein beta chain